MVSAVLRTALLLACAAIMAACESADPTVPDLDDPFLYLILAPGLSLVGEPTHEEFAVLLTVGTPFESPCRTAESFEMRRASDGTRFDWRPSDACLGVRDGESLNVYGNAAFWLPEQGGAGSLGGVDVTEGESYELAIESGGVRIEGSATVPGPFQVDIQSDATGRFAVWQRSAGAAGYLVSESGNQQPLQTDTTYRLTDPAGVVTVTALDVNAYQYMLDDQLERAGITGAYGVFGGMTTRTRNY